MTSSIRRTVALAAMAITSSMFSAASLVAQGPPGGDTDLDGDVDNFDLTKMLGNYGLFGVASAIDGDANGDAFVDGADFAIQRFFFDTTDPFASSFGSVGGVFPEPNPAHLYYNPVNGALLIDQANAQGGILTSFIVQSNSPFNLVNPVSYPFPPDFANARNLATRTASVFAQTDPNALNGPTGLPSSLHNLGNLFPPGLSPAALQATMLRGVYLGAVAGTFGVPIGQPGARLHSFQVVALPEPSAAALAIGLAATLVAAQRGRRKLP